MKKTLLFATLGAIMTTQAHAGSGVYDIGKMADQANLIFKGTVVSVDYRGSQGKGKHSSVPHTFVTYEVEDVLHGNSQRKKFTLRFLGGQNDKGEIMMVSNTPIFDVGDRDIILVDGNGVSECPLIDCVNGRFRIINDLMYSEYGDSIMLDDDGHILNGKSQELDEVSSFTIGDKTFKRLKNRDAEQEDDGSASVSEPVKGYHMDVSTFTGELRSRIAQAIPNDPRGLAKKAQNLDLNQPFNYVHAQAVSLPEPAMADSRPQPKTEQERKEINAAENNNGNPVIK